MRKHSEIQPNSNYDQELDASKIVHVTVTHADTE